MFGLTGNCALQYEITNHADESSKQPVKDLVRSKITPQLSAALSKLRDALITEHAKDLQHAPGENPSRGFSPSPVYPQTTKKESQVTATSTKPIANQGPVSTTTLTVSDEMRTTAAELYKTFTDPERITLFTRGAPRQFEGAHVGGKFAIFDGNVTGEYVKLNEPTQIVQKWRLADWAPGHYSTLTINFNQVDEYGVTKMEVEWAGVPSDLVEQTKSQWDEKYVRGLKQTFGYVFPSSFSPPSACWHSPLSWLFDQYRSFSRSKSFSPDVGNHLLTFLLVLLGIALALFSDKLRGFFTHG